MISEKNLNRSKALCECIVAENVFTCGLSFHFKLRLRFNNSGSVTNLQSDVLLVNHNSYFPKLGITKDNSKQAFKFHQRPDLWADFWTRIKASD